MTDITCAFCGAHQRSSHDTCSTCGAPLELRTQELHRQYLDAKLGRAVRAWLRAFPRLAKDSTPYETQTHDLELLEEFARLLHAPQRYFIERVEACFTVPSPQAFFTQTVTSIRETWRLGVLITGILQVLRNERLDLDIAATRARGAVARVGKETPA